MSKIISVILAVSFSFLLFVGMTYLIKPKAMEVEEVKPRERISFTYDVKDDEPTVKKYPLPEEPKEPEQPKMLTVNNLPNKPAQMSLFESELPNIIDSNKLGIVRLASLMGAGNKGAPGPKVRINPRYPAEAAKNGIEGYVTLTFDISATGHTENISVVESKPRKVFVKAAKKALRKWKYSPKIENEKPVAQIGQKVTLQFNLESDLL